MLPVWLEVKPVQEYSNAEITRRLEEVIRSIERVATTLETGYVRKDAHESSIRAIEAMHVAGTRLIEKGMEADRYAAERAAAENAQDIKDVRESAERDIAAIKRERERDDAWKKQITATLIAALIGVLASGGIAILNLLAGA